MKEKKYCSQEMNFKKGVIIKSGPKYLDSDKIFVTLPLYTTTMDLKGNDLDVIEVSKY